MYLLLSFGFCFAHLPVQLALFRQLLVQLAQLAKESIVGTDFSLMPHGGQRHSDVHSVAQHEVSSDHGGGATVAFSAVHIHLPWRIQNNKMRPLNFNLPTDFEQQAANRRGWFKQNHFYLENVMYSSLSIFCGPTFADSLFCGVST